jgi:AraC-like DNA-binding protein
LRQLFFIPNPILQSFISNIMLVEAELPKQASAPICPFPPIPNNCLYFYINDPVHIKKEKGIGYEKKAAALLVGPQTTRVNIEMGHKHLMVCVVFHPGGMHRLLHLPMHQLLDMDLNAEDLFGPIIKSLNGQLKDASSHMTIVNAIESFLIKKASTIKELLPVDYALRELVKMDGNMTVEELASLSCLSLRQFERQCKDRLGLSPKMYSRLVRFSKAYRLKEKNAQLSWGRIAASCGYFDQMHLIRDFKEFAGMNPTQIEEEWIQTPYRLQAGIKV